VVVYKNMVGLGGLAHWVTLQLYFGTTLLKGCRPLVYGDKLSVTKETRVIESRVVECVCACMSWSDRENHSRVGTPLYKLIELVFFLPQYFLSCLHVWDWNKYVDKFHLISGFHRAFLKSVTFIGRPNALNCIKLKG